MYLSYFHTSRQSLVTVFEACGQFRSHRISKNIGLKKRFTDIKKQRIVIKPSAAIVTHVNQLESAASLMFSLLALLVSSEK